MTDAMQTIVSGLTARTAKRSLRNSGWLVSEYMGISAGVHLHENSSNA